jgi:hypothetical protein
MHLGNEKTIMTPIIVFSVGQGQAGVAQHLFRVQGVIGENGDTDAGAAIDSVALDVERLLQGREKFLRQNGDTVVVAGFDLNNAEFIATQTGHRIGCAHASQQPRRDALQKNVADIPAQGFVDLLEAVKVDEMDRRQLAAAPGMAENLMQTVLGKRPVGKPGEVVIIDDLVLGFLESGDIAAEDVDVIGIGKRL